MTQSCLTITEISYPLRPFAMVRSIINRVNPSEKMNQFRRRFDVPADGCQLLTVFEEAFTYYFYYTLYNVHICVHLCTTTIILSLLYYYIFTYFWYLTCARFLNLYFIDIIIFIIYMYEYVVGNFLYKNVMQLFYFI